MNWIKRAWRGEEKLWKVFWIYWVIASIIIRIIDKATGNTNAEVYTKLDLLEILYGLWILVSLWRCAFNTKWKYLGYLVRLWCSLVLILIIMVMMGDNYKRILSLGSKFINESQCKTELVYYLSEGGKDKDGFMGRCLQKKSGIVKGGSNLLEQSEGFVQSIMEQFTKCWVLPKDAVDIDSSVVLNVQLAKDANLVNVTIVNDNGKYKSDPMFRALADSALQAVHRCTPLKNMPLDKFGVWEYIELNFKPKLKPIEIIKQ
jgi:hypothetical protein